MTLLTLLHLAGAIGNVGSTSSSMVLITFLPLWGSRDILNDAQPLTFKVIVTCQCLRRHISNVAIRSAGVILSLISLLGEPTSPKGFECGVKSTDGDWRMIPSKT